MSSGVTRYTYGHTDAVVRSHQWRTIDNSAAFLKPHLREDGKVLDVGCGPGTITADIARICSKGKVVGLDVAKSVVAKAKSSFPSSDYPSLTFVVGDVFELPFEDNSFDVVFAHQVLHHVPNQASALREMKRVCVSGGVVCCRESDYSTCVWSPPSKSLDSFNQINALLIAKNGGDPLAGQKLLAYARKAGFKDITPSASAWCFATKEDRGWWAEIWAARIMVGDQADQMRRDLRIAESDIEKMVTALRTWAENEDGWYSTTFGEVICRA